MEHMASILSEDSASRSMSSSSSESDSDSNSDSSSSGVDYSLSSGIDYSLSLTRRLLDQPWKYGSLKQNMMDRSLIVTTAIHSLIATMMIYMQRKRRRGGSTLGRRYIYRDRKACHDLIISDYFKGEQSKYTPEHFRSRFRMDMVLFNRILYAIGKYDDYFTPKVDAVGRNGFSPLQKMIAALRILAYGCSTSVLDEYIQIGESTAIESLKHFCDAVIGNFEEYYLRKPNEADIAMLFKEGDDRGFPGMLGSLDCMHWEWKNCPKAWHATCTDGFKKVPTLILEAVASKNLWIWHTFFGATGTKNDILLLDGSPLLAAPPSYFAVQGHRYSTGYYLSGGIYPQCATLIQTICYPHEDKEKIFAKQHELVSKDVERAVGVLLNRWQIVKGPSRKWNANDLQKIMKTCIILHNMIIESEHHQGINPEQWEPLANEKVDHVELQHNYVFLVSNMINRLKQVQDSGVHNHLKIDLINHLWDIHGDQAYS